MNQIFSLWAFVLFTGLAGPADIQAAKLQPQTVKAWDSYVQLTEGRIARELDGGKGFLYSDFVSPAEKSEMLKTLKSGGVYVSKLVTKDTSQREIDVPSGMIHHWFGAIFIPNMKVATLLKSLQDYDQHQKYFTEVQQSKLISRDGDTFRLFLRLMRKKVVTVYYNTEHTAIYRVLDDDRASSRSFTTKIAEVESAGTPAEKEKPAGDDSGYLWRLNSYWRFRALDGGVVVECESVSLSRSIPFGFGWIVKGFVESIPRESLENTLTSIRDGVAKNARGR